MKRVTVMMTVTGVAAALSLSAFTAAPAAADTPKEVRDSCDSERFCLYEHAHYQGGIKTFNKRDVSNYSGLTFDNGVGLNDNVSSVYNNYVWGDFDIREHENFGGIQVAFVPEKTGYRTLTFNDMASSHDW